MRRVLAALAAVALVLALSSSGSANHPERDYGFEPGNCSEFAQGCQAVSGGSVAFGSGDAYDGLRYQIASDNGSGGVSYARGVDNLTLSPGEEVWFGAAVRPASGFYDRANAQVRLFAWDTYPSSPYMRGGVWVDSSDRVVVYRHVDGGQQTPLVVLGTRALPEGVWTMVEIRQRLSTGPSALTEVYVNGVLVGSSSLPNLARSATITRYRVGLGDSSLVTNPIRVDFDRAYIGSAPRGVLAPPAPEPEPEPEPEPAPYIPACAFTCDEQLAALQAQVASLQSSLSAETARANLAEQQVLEATQRAELAEQKLEQIRTIVGG
jgi:hypothetical protein